MFNHQSFESRPLKTGHKTIAVYAVVIVLLVFLAYFVQNDTRRVDGISMLPTLEGGDLVVIQNVPFDSIHIGDIIVYNNLCSTQGESVIHRVVAINGNGFITKGDNNPFTDQQSSIAVSEITPDCLVGKVVFVVPYVEYLAYLIDQQQLPPWFNYLPAVLVLIIAVYLLLGGDDEEEKTMTGEPQKPV